MGNRRKTVCATDTRGTSRAQCSADAETLRHEQLDDETLKGWWSLAKRGKGGFFMNNGLLPFPPHGKDFGSKLFSVSFTKISATTSFRNGA